MNGITIYYLLNDIDFKDVDCTELKQIGYAQTNYYFSQIFDGQITPFIIYLSIPAMAPQVYSELSISPA